MQDSQAAGVISNRTIHKSRNLTLFVGTGNKLQIKNKNDCTVATAENNRIIGFSGKTGTLVSEINTEITEKKAWQLILPGGPQLGPEAMETGVLFQVTADCGLS